MRRLVGHSKFARYALALGLVLPLLAPTAGWGGVALFAADARNRGHSPGKATLAGALLSGIARAMESFLIAVAIAAGSGIVLKLWYLLAGGIR